LMLITSLVFDILAMLSMMIIILDVLLLLSQILHQIAYLA
jgi:hypothetical protein